MRAVHGGMCQSMRGDCEIEEEGVGLIVAKYLTARSGNR